MNPSSPVDYNELCLNGVSYVIHIKSSTMKDYT